MFNVSRNSFIIILIILALIAGCTDRSVNDVHRTDFIASESFDFSYDALSHSGIRLDGVNCDIDINCVPEANTVLISGIREVGSDSYADAEYYLQYLTVDVNSDGDILVITVEQPSNTEWRSFNVEFEITIPSEYGLDIAIVNGDVDFGNLVGDAAIEITNGDITFDRIIGECDLRVINGQITGKSDLPESGTARFSAVNGILNIKLSQTTSAQFTASVVNGNISVSDLNFHNSHETRTSFSGTLGSGHGTIRMNVVNGTISAKGY